MATWRASVAVALAMSACHASDAPTIAVDTTNSMSSSEGVAASSEGATSSDDGSSSSTAAIEDGPPVVVDVGKSASSLGEGESLTITAFVQHPRGAAAVVAGTLSGPGELEDYGEFLPGENGRWSIDIGWDDVAAHTELTFEDEIDIELLARFVDDAGLEAEAIVLLPLRCTPLAPMACDGVCVDLSVSTNNCGECDAPCTVQNDVYGFPVGGCGTGTCAPIWSECVDSRAFTDCTSVCTLLGSTCAEAGCNGYTILPVADESACGEIIEPGGFADPDTCTAPLGGPIVRCCCAQ